MGAPHADGTVGKALSLLDTVAAYGRPVRFAELLENSIHPKATLYRLLQTLTNQGMLAYDTETHSYTLGLRLMRLAHSAWKQASLAPVARTYLDRLSQHIGETVHLAQLDHGQVLYVDKRNARRPISMFSDAGKVGPGYCTGVGKAMLAFLDDDLQAVALQHQSYFPHTPTTHASPDSLRAELRDIRESGIAFDREEHEANIICVALPILSSTGKPLGAISVTSSTARHSLDQLATFAPAIRETAQAIARDAQTTAFPDTPVTPSF
ncbi:MAG: IclR family transcriptional regulator [Pseudomonadota bacterium]